MHGASDAIEAATIAHGVKVRDDAVRLASGKPSSLSPAPGRVVVPLLCEPGPGPPFLLTDRQTGRTTAGKWDLTHLP